MARKFLADGSPNPHYSTPAAKRTNRTMRLTFSPEAMVVLQSWPAGTRSERASAAIVEAAEKSYEP